MTYKLFHPVEAHEDDGVHYYVMTPDPIRGEVVGEYADLATAFYYANIRNNHQDRHYALNEFEHMYHSEISFLLVGMWDGGIEWCLGNGPTVEAMLAHATERGTRGNQPTLVEALVEMVNAARHTFPDSAYTRGRPTDISLRTTPTLHELLWKAEDKCPGFKLESTRDRDPDPYEPQWVCHTDADIEWGGSTPEEALTEMIEANQ